MGSTSVYRETKGKSTFELIVDELPVTLGEHGENIVAHATSTTESHDCGSSIFWAAVRDKDHPERTWCLCVLYLRRAETYTQLGEFWHKDMDETVGPGYYDVPDKVWNALTPLPDDAGEYARDWRAKVAEYRANRKGATRRPRTGEVIEFARSNWSGSGLEGIKRFRLTDRPSVFVPLHDDGTEGYRVRLSGWTTSAYQVVA